MRQALSEADARVGVRLKGGPQELHVLLGEAGPLPAAGAARGAAAGGRGPPVVWGGERQQVHNPGTFSDASQRHSYGDSGDGPTLTRHGHHVGSPVSTRNAGRPPAFINALQLCFTPLLYSNKVHKNRLMRCVRLPEVSLQDSIFCCPIFNIILDLMIG